MLEKKPLHTSNTRSSPYTMPLPNRPAHSKATPGDGSISLPLLVLKAPFQTMWSVYHHCYQWSVARRQSLLAHKGCTLPHWSQSTCTYITVVIITNIIIHNHLITVHMYIHHCRYHHQYHHTQSPDHSPHVHTSLLLSSPISSYTITWSQSTCTFLGNPINPCQPFHCKQKCLCLTKKNYIKNIFIYVSYNVFIVCLILMHRFIVLLFYAMILCDSCFVPSYFSQAIPNTVFLIQSVLCTTVS